MNVLVLLLVVGASLAIGMASLDNDIVTNAQDLGVGEKTIDSEIDASLILVIERTGPDFELNYKDVIVECKFTNEGPNTIEMGSIIYCKLLDAVGNLIAEGSEEVTDAGGLGVGEEIIIPVDDFFAFPNSNNVENVDEIVFVVQGPPQA